MNIRKGWGDTISVFRNIVSLKGVQPRIVLGLLLVGSFAGVWLSHMDDSVLIRSYWWVVVVAIGLLAGGLYWRVFFFDGTEFENRDTLCSVRHRWRRLETGAVWTLFLCGVAGLAIESISIRGGVVLFSGFVLVPLLWLGIVAGDSDQVPNRAAYLRYALLAAGLGLLCSFAWMETGTGIVDWMIRVGHVGSFALWIGGASWHNFVVLPTVRSDPAAKTVLKSQARRFRRHLPVVIPLFFLTGVYQVAGLIGPSVPSVFATRVGRLIWFKILVLIALTGLVIVNLRRAKSASSS